MDQIFQLCKRCSCQHRVNLTKELYTMSFKPPWLSLKMTAVLDKLFSLFVSETIRQTTLCALCNNLHVCCITDRFVYSIDTFKPIPVFSVCVIATARLLLSLETRSLRADVSKALWTSRHPHMWHHLRRTKKCWSCTPDCMPRWWLRIPLRALEGQSVS